MKRRTPKTPPEIPTPRPPEETARRLKTDAAARAAAELSEMKTEGRTPRPFRTNPHD